MTSFKTNHLCQIFFFIMVSSNDMIFLSFFLTWNLAIKFLEKSKVELISFKHNFSCYRKMFFFLCNFLHVSTKRKSDRGNRMNDFFFQCPYKTITEISHKKNWLSKTRNTSLFEWKSFRLFIFVDWILYVFWFQFNSKKGKWHVSTLGFGIFWSILGFNKPWVMCHKNKF